jgi:hypothetical protein
MEAVGNKIRLNSQGRGDVRVIGERWLWRIRGGSISCPEHGPAKFERIDQDGLHEAPKDFE